MNKLGLKFNKSFKPGMAILVMVLSLCSVLAMPNKASAQFYGDDGLNYGGSYDFGSYGDTGGLYDNAGLNYGGSYDFGSGYDSTGYGYSDPYSYGGDYGSSYGYDNSCCDYGSSYDSNCCDYGNSYSNYDCCSYGSSYGNCCSTPSYSYNPPHYYNPPVYNPPVYNPPSSPVINNNNTNVNNNTNNNNVVVNVPTSPAPYYPPPTPTYPTLTAYCTANPSNPLVGNQVSFQAYASGGNGNYSYSWNGDVNGGGQTVYQTFYNSGTKNAYVTVSSNGQQVSASCSANVQPNGSTISNITVYQQPTPLGTPTAGVFLSQIPATGINPSLKMALFALGLIMWSAFGAYMILEKRKFGALTTVGISASEMETEDSEDMETANPAEQPINEDPAQELESNLSFRARENNVLISRDGIEAILRRSGNERGAAEAMLTEIIGKVSRNEGDYAALNGEKVNLILNS